MEISAALDAARTLEGPLEVVSDSTYVVNCFRARWWEKWLANGWKNAARQPVANDDLWKPLVALYRAAPGRLSFRWVKGHSTDPFNDLVDRLAVAAANSQRGQEGDEPPDLGALGRADSPGGRAGRAHPAGGREGRVDSAGGREGRVDSAGGREGRATGTAARPLPGPGSAAGVRLRPARGTDAQAVLHLWRTAGAHSSVTDDLAGVRALMAHDSEALVVAEVAGEIVGTVIAGWDGWRANFARLVVHPDWRRRGIASALVTGAERRLAVRGARRAGAIVFSADPGAVAFWEAAGYSANLLARRHTKTLPEP
jgi:ribonuclease HI